MTLSIAVCWIELTICLRRVWTGHSEGSLRSSATRSARSPGAIEPAGRPSTSAPAAVPSENAVSADTAAPSVSRAFAINDAGLIAGRASDATEPVNPAICPAPLRCVPLLYREGAWAALATLPGIANASAVALNNAGQAVGLAQPPDGAGRALLWDGTAVSDLNTLIPAGSGWALTEALSIADRGQIVGNGTLNGQQRGYLLTPAAMPGLPNTGAGAGAGAWLPAVLLAAGVALAALGSLTAGRGRQQRRGH